MRTDEELPGTPDFEHYPVAHRITGAAVDHQGLRISWSDGRFSEHHALFLRENSPDPATIHPESRELLISPLDIPEDLRPLSADVDRHGALRVTWSDGSPVSRFHPGWLRAHAWFDDTGPEPETGPRLWRGDELESPPSFDGPAVLDADGLLLRWLETLRDYGLARLRGLEPRDGLLEALVTRIGTVRETNFGRIFHVVVKDDPDSNAYTSVALTQHMDIPTRECPPGLQFLFCRRNEVSGGEGIYVDGYRVAEDMRREEPEHFEALTGIEWEYRNRARNCDYRARSPVIGLDRHGRVNEIRFNTFLRGPLKAPLADQARAYRAVRAMTRRNQSPAYQVHVRYRPGDLLAFDNRRVLHGRTAYDSGGERFLEGVYADRDDLHSRIRWLRQQRARAAE